MSDAALPSVPRSAVRLPWGLLAGFLALIAIMLLPTPTGLPVAGHRMLAILVFAVIVWITEAVDYAVSSVIIVALIAVLLGTSPALDDPTKAFGRARGLSLGLGGFANSSLALDRKSVV
jgi:sodium-dependent dicarboxylate transporter 2/3/5